jgi:3D (Asp-Asp-Asp) domain-containing protein
MNRRRRPWKRYWIGVGILCFLMLSYCHPVMPSFRRPDAVMEMKTTGYCACGKCCSWKISWYGLPVHSAGPRKGKRKTIGKTASGTMARPGTVAVDPELFPMGTKFHIPGYGWGIARDTGGSIKGRHLDLFFRLHVSARKWGVQSKQVKVWYPED